MAATFTSTGRVSSIYSGVEKAQVLFADLASTRANLAEEVRTLSLRPEQKEQLVQLEKDLMQALGVKNTHQIKWKITK